MRHSSILVDKNNQSWLAIEGNIIRVFTTKISAVQYREENSKSQINVLHRYDDGSLHPLFCWPHQPHENQELLFEDHSHEFDDPNEFDSDIDFYDLCTCAANDEDFSEESDDQQEE